MTNKEKALALISTFASGDTKTAASLLAEGYIQHNLSYGTGRDAFLSSVEYLAAAPVKTTVKNIRAFEDGTRYSCRQSTTLQEPVNRLHSISSALMRTALLQNTGTILFLWQPLTHQDIHRLMDIWQLKIPERQKRTENL